MMEENNISLASGDALVYMAEPIHKNIPQHLFVAIHLVRTYLMTNFSDPFPCTHLYIFWMTSPPSIPPVAYVLNRWPVSQLKNK